MLLDRTGVIDDRWSVVIADDPTPDGPAILPRERLAEATGRTGPTGLHIANDADPHDLVAAFDRLALISVGFPSFADGRGFSVARVLRELDFTGRLRATGPVIADQFAYLLECGFDEVAVPESIAQRQPAEQWLEQLSRLSTTYQRGALAGAADRGVERASILDQRRGASR
ncbi:MAG: DUF934 domain-containing protein [Pseudomonadota bacterium]